MAIIKAEDILQATNGGFEIIVSLYPDAAQSLHNLKRPFKARPEGTASATLLLLDDGNYIVYDFGGDRKKRNGILCYMEETNCDFPTALQELAVRYNVAGAEAETNTLKAIYSERAATVDEVEGTWFPLIRESWTDFEIETIFSKEPLKKIAWKSNDKEKSAEAYSRIAALLKEYRWHPIVSYSIVKNRKYMTFEATDEFPIFMIDEGTHKKYYLPKHPEKHRRFMYEPGGSKPKHFLHGFEQLKKAYNKKKVDIDKDINQQREDDDRDTGAAPEEKKDTDPRFPAVFYCTGGSDALNVALLRPHCRVLWPNGETEKLQPFHYTEIKICAHKLINVPDIDDTGKREAHTMAMQYLDILTLNLPASLKEKTDRRGKPCKDVRDFLNHFKDYDFEQLEKTAMPYRFWEKVEKIDKDGNKKGTTYELKNTRVYNFLQNNGFYRYKVGDKKLDWEFIKITGSMVQFVDGNQIRDHIKQFLRERQMPEELRDAVFNTTRLNDTSMANLDFTELSFIDFDKGKQYYFFDNQAVEVTKDAIIKPKQGDITSYVWEDDVIHHRIELLKESPFEITKDDQGTYDIKVLHNNCMFFNYLINTSRTHWRKELETGEKYKSLTPVERDEYKANYKFSIDGPNLDIDEINEQKQHLINKIFVIGYLLHRYKDSSRTWMIFAMDGHTREDFLSHGGSGKSILFNVAMKQMLKNNFNINGRDINIDKNSHKYDGVSEFTRYLTIEDAHQYLNLDVFFNDITGDLEVNPKGKTPYSIKFAQSPKFALTTNFTGRNMGGSTLRRLLNTVFADYYHTATSDNDYLETRTPNTEFGLNLVDHFDRTQNNYFFNTMLFCLKFYLGVSEKLEPNMSNVTRRQLAAVMGEGFHSWAKAYFADESQNLNRLITREEVFFDMKYTTQNHNHSPQLFYDKLSAFCKLYGYVLNPKDMLGKQGSIIKRVNKMHYDKVSNIWTPLEGTHTKEMLFVQSSADIPDNVKAPGHQEKDNPAPNLFPSFKIEEHDDDQESFPIA